MRIIFFGSTSDSVIVLDKLSNLQLIAVVTQPPRPVGRKQILQATPVELWAEQHHLPVLSFPSNPNKPWLYQNDEEVTRKLLPLKADVLISACYGQKIPFALIQAAQYGGLNVHPSSLPRWRGADPVPWAIAAGDHETGVSIVTLSQTFDQGQILAQVKVPITKSDTSDELRSKLFRLGANLLIEVLPKYFSGEIKGKSQSLIDTPYARRLTRDDGYEPWASIKTAMETGEEAQRIERKFRAFDPWPGLWTKVKMKGEEKRLKIIKLHLNEDRLVLDIVQIEGKTPVNFEQFKIACFN